MKKKMAGIAAAVLTSAALPLGLGVATAGVASAAPAARAGVSAQDVKWMKSNAQTDLAEITISRIALKRAELSDTKAMATVTFANHTKLLADLKVLAKRLGVTLPANPNGQEQAQAAALKTIPAGRFDRLFDTDQIKGHLLSISSTKTEINKGHETAVVKFAAYYLPIAEKHLKMARADFAALPAA